MRSGFAVVRRVGVPPLWPILERLGPQLGQLVSHIRAEQQAFFDGLYLDSMIRGTLVQSLPPRLSTHVKEACARPVLRAARRRIGARRARSRIRHRGQVPPRIDSR
jgi:hypothetical protein